jgi:hypothetical protein
MSVSGFIQNDGEGRFHGGALARACKINHRYWTS